MTHQLRLLGLKSLWWLSYLLWPILYWQYRQLRKQWQFPHSTGSAQATLPGQQPACRLLLLGEAAVAGASVMSVQQTFAAQIAQHLNRHSQRRIQWQTLGSCEIDLVKMEHWLIPQVEPLQPDVLIIVLGFNDTIQLTSLAEWRAGLYRVIHEVRVNVRQGIYFTAVPPLQQLTTLPNPLRQVLGIRAALLDEELQSVLRFYHHCWYIPAAPLQGQHLTHQGTELSAQGYAYWGQAVAHFILQQQPSCLHSSLLKSKEAHLF